MTKISAVAESCFARIDCLINLEFYRRTLVPFIDQYGFMNVKLFENREKKIIFNYEIQTNESTWFEVFINLLFSTGKFKIIFLSTIKESFVLFLNNGYFKNEWPL